MPGKRWRLLAVLAMTLGLLTALPASEAGAADAMLRVVHASPDAPAVDVYLNNQRAMSGLKFGDITSYANVPEGSYRIRVFPAGADPSSKAVIDAQGVALAGGKAYTVLAVNKLASIEPLVVADDLTAPAAGKAHIRVIHASPDAPAVDVAVKGGPVPFRNIAFKTATPYAPVDAGTYTFEVRPAGTTTAAITTDPVPLAAGRIYTAYAIGLLADGSLKVILSTDNSTPGMPNTGAGGSQSESRVGGIASLALAASLLVVLVTYRRLTVAARSRQD